MEYYLPQLERKSRAIFQARPVLDNMPTDFLNWLKRQGFPFQNTLDEFDLSQFNPSISPAFLHELASCQFIQDWRNMVMIGNPGRGKTHLSVARGLKACCQGHNVFFKNTVSLSTELCEDKNRYTLGKLERTLAKADLLILDELSYLSFNRH